MNHVLVRVKDVIVQGHLAVWIVLCVVLGGATNAGIAANAFLQLLGLLIILGCLWRLTTIAGKQKWTDLWTMPGNAIKGIATIICAIAFWVLIQLIPLPAAIWHMLGDRDIIIEGDRLLGISGAFRPLSMQPNATLNSASWIIAPLATFLLTIGAKSKTRRVAGYAIIAIALLSSLLGVAQIGQGPDSPTYFYSITNANTSVGFFANSNHLATLYLCALVLVPWLFFAEAGGRRRDGRILANAGLVVAAMLMVDILVNRSLAGFVLAVPAVAFVAFHHPTCRGWIDRLPFSLRTLGIALGAATLVATWLLFGYFGQFAVGLTDPETRLSYYAHTLEIARAAAPFGIGLGVFRWIYTGFEDPSTVDLTYVNHAHNDYVELLAEGGIFFVILLAAFGFWMWNRFVRIRDLADWQVPAYLSSAMIVAMVAGHSLVDYPARTAAIAAIAAFGIGSLASVPMRR